MSDTKKRTISEEEICDKNENTEATKRPTRLRGVAKSPLRENDVNEGLTRKRKLSEAVAVPEMTPCSKTSRVANGLVAKTKYCICQSEYDKKRFYIQCDACHSWFHGDCVGVTPERAEAIDEYVCEGCSKLKVPAEAKELYCVCAKPYDERLFYIGCDRCNGWFHGSCVGVMACEADTLETYVCPKCLRADAKEWMLDRRVTEKNIEIIKSIVCAMKNHNKAWPFIKPVDVNEVPNYYNIIKEPMDLSKVEAKVNKQQYERYVDFIHDVAKIFENCRLFNPAGSTFCKCANALEKLFVEKLKILKTKI